MSREDMEELSKTVELRYMLGVMNSQYASVLLTNLRGVDYHIYPDHIRNIPNPICHPRPAKAHHRFGGYSLEAGAYKRARRKKSQSAGRHKQRKSRNRPYKHTHLLCLYVCTLWPFRRRYKDCGGGIEEIFPFL